MPYAAQTFLLYLHVSTTSEGDGGPCVYAVVRKNDVYKRRTVRLHPDDSEEDTRKKTARKPWRYTGSGVFPTDTTLQKYEIPR